jgi:hypothetical protein
MADEQVVAPAVALDPPASDPVVEKEAPQEVVDEVVPETPETDEPAEQDETDELEFGFKKYRVPKELKTAVEEWRSATTKKEQSVADERKTLEAARLQQVKASDAELDARAQLRTVAAELKRFEAFDFAQFQALHGTDPLGADQAWAYKQDLKDRHAALTETINKAAAERTEYAQQDLAKRVQETLAEAPKIIPGWKADTGSQAIEKLVQFGHSLGIPEQAMKDNWSPALLKLLHRASIGEQSLQKAAAPPPKAPPAEAVVPLSTVSAKSAPAAKPSLAQLAKEGRMEEYVAARRAGRVR